MKVLLVYPRFYVYGGGESLVVRLCNYLTANRIENSILTTEMLTDIERDLKNTDIIYCEKPLLKGCLKDTLGSQYMATARAFNNHIMKIEDKYDLINIHNFPVELSVKNVSKPVVWMCNEPELHLTFSLPSFNKLKLTGKISLHMLFHYQKHMVKHFIDKTVVSDEFNYARLQRIYGISPEIIPYGIDGEYYAAGSEISLDMPGEYRFNSRFVVLHVGMITPLKNQMETLQTINIVRKYIPEILAVFAGANIGDSYWEECNSFIRQYDLAENVLFYGHVDRDVLRKLYYSSDVMLHPIKSQGGWLSPFEMLCACRPVIVSEDLTCANIMKNENIAIVTSDYTVSLLDVYKRPKEYREMAKRGRDYVLKNLSWDSFGSRMLEVFRTCVGNN